MKALFSGETSAVKRFIWDIDAYSSLANIPQLDKSKRTIPCNTCKPHGAPPEASSCPDGLSTFVSAHMVSLVGDISSSLHPLKETQTHFLQCKHAPEHDVLMDRSENMDSLHRQVISRLAHTGQLLLGF